MIARPDPKFSRFGTTTYTWDARNRLIAQNGPGVTATFQYDALGRRVSKTINGVTTSYLYDGNDIVQEIGGSAVGASYVRSLSIDEPFVRQTSASNEFYHVDALGSTLDLTNQVGAVQASYHYEVFGKTTMTGTSSNPFQYTGRENDGTGLYYYRERFYSPLLQRFISQDPVYRVAGNTYAYAKNNPIIGRDPFGLYTAVIRGGSGTSGSGAGMEALANGLRAGGETVEIFNPGQTAQATAAAEAAAARGEPVNIVGHSRGGDAAVSVAGNLLDSNVTVNNLVTIDSFSKNEVTKNVQNNVNIYETQSTWPWYGKPNTGAQNTNNIVVNGYHTDIDQDKGVQLIACITVLGGRKNAGVSCNFLVR